MNFKLTPQQKLIESMDSYAENSVTSITGELTILDNINLELLKVAYNKLIENIETLRTRVVKRNDEVFQYYAEYEYEDIPVISFDTEKEKNNFAEADAKKRVPLFDGRLYRSYILKCKETSEVSLLMTLNHIIADAWTTYLIKRELTYYCESLMAGENPQATVLGYSGYIEKEAKYHSSKRYEKDKKFWVEEFVDYEKQNMFLKNSLNSASERLTIEFTDQETKRFGVLMKKLNTTSNNLMMSLLLLYIFITERNNDVCIGTALYNRPDNEDKKTVGMMVNTVAFRYDFSENDRFCDYVKKLEKKQLSVFMHQKFNYGELLKELRNAGRNAKLFDIMFNYQIIPEGSGRAGLKWYHCGNTDELLTMTLIQYNDRYCIHYDYKTECLSKMDVLTIHARLLAMLAQAEACPEMYISEIEVLTAEERKLILNDFNATKTEYPKNKTVVELFEEQVKKTPDNIAVLFEEQELTYAELNARANSLAHKLRGLGVKPDDFVAIIADRSFEMIAGIYGIIKAGGAYVPIDPTYPEERIRYMLEDCAPKAVLKYTTESIELNTEIPVIDLGESEIWKEFLGNPEVVNKPNDLIYCIYTSGTTGKPKGVMIEHHGIVAMQDYLEKLYVVTEQDNVLQFANYIFDASVWEMTLALYCGATLVLVSSDVITDTAEFERYVSEKNVTLTLLPPQYFRQIDIESFRVMTTGGSASDSDVVKHVKENCKYINAYGPTENTVLATHWEYEHGTEVPVNIPIGKPISNSRIYMLNGDAICGIGVPGELCIAGDGLARGYLNRPELTAEKFVKNPFGEGKMYRTGDLARWLPDGNIEYLGRIDEQVKIRGFRIELGEIESRIREIENIKDCAVIAKADRTGDKAIYAYYTSDSEVSVSEIRDRLSESLPEYMVPAYMMQIDTIPVTRNGKLDKRALPEIHTKNTKDYVAPRNEIEEKICNIFGEILNVEHIGVKDSFFELGGHSLRATRLVNCIEAETGTRISLKEVFAHPTVEQLAVLAGSEREKYVPIPKAEKKEYYLMSSTQKRTYLIQQMQPEAVTYNMPQNMKFTGEVRPEDLRNALQSMIDRHEILRTQFLIIDGEPVQKILDYVEADFEYVSSSESDEKLMTDFCKPFDLASAKLVRVKLVNKDEYYLMMFDMHHIVSDGMSVNTFIKEFMTLYNGEKLEPLSHQFKDYSEWMQSRDLSAQAEYWKRQFDDELPVLDMPTDFPRPQEKSYVGTMTGALLDEGLSGKIKELVKKSGATEYMVFLAAAMVTLSKYSRQEDIVIGSPISGRTHKDTEGMLGMFVNTLAMRGKPEKNKTFAQFLKEIKETCFRAYENQEYPFEELVEVVDIQRDMSRNPIFDVLLVLQNNESTEVKLGESEGEETGVASTIAKFDLTFNITEYDGKFGIMLEYCTDLFKAETAEGIVKHYEEVLKAITANADQKIGCIEMVTSDEKQLILNEFNATEAEYPRYKTVVELFEEQVKKTPDNIALVFEEESLTYAELNARANSLANKLRNLGVKPDDFVAIIADRSLEMICGIYGIIKSGGAYVPIDPTYPEERISFMLKDSSPKAVLKYTTEIIAISEEVPVIDLQKEDVWEGAAENPEHINTPNDLIYCIYTSGTTGKPKGVMQLHKTIVNLIYDEYRTMGRKTFMQTLFATNYGFDVSVQEYFSTLLCGGTGYIITLEDKQDHIRCMKIVDDKKIKTMFTTPSYFDMLSLEETEKLAANIENAVLAGESFKVSNALLENENAFNMKLHNHYGPTESHVVTTNQGTVAELRKSKTLNLGKPVANNKIYILDSDILCGIGVPGELCIAGDGLARGYLNRPELTAEKFLKNPFGEGKMYRTGDLARWLPDGNIEYLGRIDEQVKIRGFRIELGEIESRIREIENIKDCAVIAKADRTGDKAIYAYYTSDSEVSVSEIRDRLSESLPEYMVPAYMMQIDTIPVTRNGKLDKRALPEIKARAINEYVAPENQTQKIICDIFGEILSVEKVGIKDSFFELGGHSLKATKLINRIEEKTGVRLTIKDVFTCYTPEQLAQLLNDRNNVVYTPIPAAENKEFYLMAPAQKRLFILQQMYPESTSYNLPSLIKIKGKVDRERLSAAIRQLVDKHEILRSSYMFENGKAVYKIIDDVYDILEYEKGEIKDEQKLLMDFVRPFNLSEAPLMRVKLVEGEEESALLIDIHHIISDGTSVNLLISEFSALYNGTEYTEHYRNYKDYSEWMHSRDQSYQRDYWVSQFDDEIPALTLPEDHIRTVDSKRRSQNYISEIDSSICRRIDEIAHSTGTTDYMILLACLMITLGTYSRQEDVIIGCPVSGRIHKDTEVMQGMFVNTLALRGKPEGTKTFSKFLSEVKDTCLKAYENQEYSFDELVEQLGIKNDQLHNPLFDVMLSLKNMDQFDFKIGDNETDIVTLKENIAKFDMTIELARNNDIYSINTEYCCDIYNEATIDDIISHFILVIDKVTASPDIMIESINFITDKDMQLWDSYNDSAMDIPVDSLENIVRKQCLKTPDRTAVICGRDSVTYGELWDKVLRVAGYLHHKGCGRNDSIAVSGERSIETIVNIIGILAAGCVYVPENPEYPESRNKYISENSGCKMRLDAESYEKLGMGEYEPYCCQSDPDSVAYTIYTSGSTGLPKGVIIKHHAAVNTILDINAKFSINENDRFILLSAFSFDLSVYDIFGALSAGASVVIVENQKDPTEIKGILQNHSITMCNSVPAIMTMYLMGEGVGSDSLRNVLLSGDWIPMDLPDKIRSVFQNAEVTSLGGATEASIWSIFYPIKEIPENMKSIPYGMPLANQKMLLLNSAGKLMPVGAIGEICIAGQGVAEGYANQPEKTAVAFKEHKDFGMVYHTGDIGRMHKEGFMEFMGRLDDQVKIRGFRIELGEIENKLREVDSVKDCAVIVRDDSNGEKAIYAYYTGDDEIDAAYIKNCLRGSLPEYMIPPFMMQIDSIPVTKNGKIDKKSLPEIKAPAAKERVEPRNDIERKLLDIYKKVINAEDISVVENFFDIGGNSLKVMQVFSELGEVYPDTVKIVDLFANPSIEQLAVFIEKKLNGRSKNQIKGIVLPEAFFGEFGSEKDRVGRVIDAEVFNKLKSEMSGCLFEFMIAAYVLTLSKLCGSNEITLQCMNDRNGNIHQLTIDLGDTENFLDLVEKIRNDLEDPSLKYNVNDYVKPVFDNKETVTSIIVNGNLKYKYTELFDIAIGVDISDRLEFEGDSHNRRLEQSALADIINGYSEIVNTITDML